MTEPHVAQHRIVSFLVEEELSAVAESNIHFTILVDVWRIAKATGCAMQIENGALADIDEESNISLTPNKGERWLVK